MAEAWPADVPTTLWTYQSLTLKAIPQVPMMGVTFADGFLLSAAFGALFLIVFARERFMEQTRSAELDDIAVLTKLRTRDLGGHSALRKAYMIYATVLLILYVALTFFGKLIFSLTNKLPVAGIDVDVTRIQFDQPTWALTVAFGLAGLGPLLPPARIAEDWLRDRAYRAVGIPTRIQKTTQRIVAALDRAGEEAGAGTTDLGKELRSREEDLRKRIDATGIGAALGRTDRYGEFLLLHSQLELLISWARGKRGAWPGIEVAESVRRLEAGLVEEGENLLNDFHLRLADHPSAAAAAAPAGSEAALKEENRQASLRTYVAETLGKMRRLRRDLASIVAVFVERDPVTKDDAEISDKALADLLRAADPIPIGSGPERALGLAILCLIPVYGVGVWRGIHPPFVWVADTDAPLVIATTALLEGLRLGVVLWLPVLAAFSVRQFMVDGEKWQFSRRGDYVAYLGQRAAAVMVAVGCAFLGLTALCLLWAFLQAPSEARFNEILFTGAIPFLLFYPSMLFISVVVVWSALAGADSRRRGGGGGFYGLAGALLVFAVQYFHVGIWYDFTSCEEGRHFLTDIAEEDCFKNYGGLDFIVLPLLTWFTAWLFGDPEVRTPAQRRRSSLLSREMTTAAVIGMLALFLPDAPRAEPVGQGGEAAQVIPRPVRLGFRDDAEPFSFRSEGNTGQEARYKYAGYVADICHEIFAGPNFMIEEKTVNASDRFRMLRDGEIDVLCDPVTLRLSDPEREGLYSPIIFMSGVSYLRVLQREAGARMQIAYVRGSTAEDVAKRACEVDLFGIVPAKNRANLPIICATSWAVSTFDPKRWPNDRGLEALRLAVNKQIRWAKSDLDAALKAVAGEDCGEADSCIERVNALAACFVGAKDCPTDALHQGDAAEQVARIASRKRGDAVKDAYKRSRVWDEINSMLNRTDCDENTCGEELFSTLRKVGYDNYCEVKDNYGATRYESIYYKFCPKDSHEKAIAWLCTKRFGFESNLVYMGDRDIILGKLRTWNLRNDRCDVENPEGADNLTYEPYALLFRRKAWLAEAIQRGVYDFFSRRTHAIGVFETYFPDRKMSTALSYLFLLNAVEEESHETTRATPIQETPPTPLP